jgi:acetoin utilization deacetylase AcuC-like enzyme
MASGCTNDASQRALPVFYTDKMVAPSGSFSPSAEKPAQVVASWRRLGLRLDLREPTPATPEELSLAHDPSFVREVLAGTRLNGFGNRSGQVAASLPYTSGSMLSAARHALREGGAAAAPCSGFHHAGYDRASGFCTFNGLMVAACALRREGARKVGILDCDMHYGDGTDDIIRRLAARSWVAHFSAGESFTSPRQVGAFFDRLDRELARMRDCDVVLYQAGADPHVDDPLGGWLATAELRARDARVFERLQAASVPVAWNLAGGYQRDASGGIPKVLEIHDNTARECARVFGYD